MILVIPDADILRFIRRKFDDTEDIELFIGAALTWIVNQMARTTEAKKDVLKRKIPGSVLSYEPKFIWVRMMDCINGTSKTLRLRKLFNSTLDTVLSKKVGYFVLDVEQAMADVAYFDNSNKLNDYGHTVFWTEIDKQIEKFKKRQISLKPFSTMRSMQQGSHRHSEDQGLQRRTWFPRRGGRGRCHPSRNFYDNSPVSYK